MSTHPAWPVGPRRPVLRADAVHVWSVDLDEIPHDEALSASLSVEERRRAARYAAAPARRRFVGAHIALRALLAAYLDLEPSAVELAVGDFGKPHVSINGNGSRLRFNVAHSGELALVAVSLCREVGVDVEQIRPQPDLMQVAERYFATGELAVLRAIPVEQRLEAFYRCWSRKEACIKGTGHGLSLPLGSFDVCLDVAEPGTLLIDGCDAHGATQWQLRDISLRRSYAAALTVEGTAPVDVTMWRWPVPDGRVSTARPRYEHSL